jgi:hypothetical protein
MRAWEEQLSQLREKEGGTVSRQMARRDQKAPKTGALEAGTEACLKRAAPRRVRDTTHHDGVSQVRRHQMPALLQAALPTY